ncbi:MAG: CAP domain-containing protein [Isosphaeraceae bacterium]|nr:CAP domain-containing protein [Isosphaeraceae bacterium]
MRRKGLDAVITEKPRSVRRQVRATAIALVALSTLALADDPAPGRPTAAELAAVRKIARELLEAHNRERAAEKLAPLELDELLCRAAEEHALDMAQHSKMSHEGSNGSTPADRIKLQRYRYISVGENVAVGQLEVDEVVEDWMNSPGHRKNILGDFQHLGAGVFKDQEGRAYWAVSFGTPMPRLNPERASAEAAALIIAERVAAEESKLEVSPKLAAAAGEVARAFAKAKSMEGDDVDLDVRLRRAGYRYSVIARSAASGPPLPKDLVQTLIDDEEQRDQLMGDFREIGVGYAQDDEATPYWCVLLARPARR